MGTYAMAAAFSQAPRGRPGGFAGTWSPVLTGLWHASLLPVVAVRLKSDRGRVQAVPGHLMVPGTAGVAAQPMGLWRHGAVK